MGVCEVLIPLTNSPSVEVQGNSAAALGNLSSKAAEDYAPFNAVWNQPDGGLHAYLVRFLGSTDQTFQHIAVWTIVQLLEAEDETLTNNIRSSPILLSQVKQLGVASPGSRSQTSSPDRRGGGQSDDEVESSAAGEGGAGEIASLARRILSLTDAGSAEGGNGGRGGENPKEDHAELRASVHHALDSKRS